MAQYTVTAFKWSGTYYNNVYKTAHKAVIEDDDKSYGGSKDADERISIDGGKFATTSGSPYVIKVSFVDVKGMKHVEEFDFFNTGGSWYFVPEPGSAFTEGARLGSYQSHKVGWDYSDVACFCAGTRILTDRGPVVVEALEPGDRIVTYGGGAAVLRLVLQRRVSVREMRQNPGLCPVRIVAGAMGCGLPHRDLRISRQHRMLVSSPVAQRMFGTREVLLSAIKLAQMPGIFVEEDAPGARYFHLVFDRHQVVLAEGAPSESFYVSAATLELLGPAARAELTDLFPDLVQGAEGPRMARFEPGNTRQKRLVARHLQNNKPLLERPAPRL
jgi:hypothetical protein